MNSLSQDDVIRPSRRLAMDQHVLGMRRVPVYSQKQGKSARYVSVCRSATQLGKGNWGSKAIIRTESGKNGKTVREIMKSE